MAIDKLTDEALNTLHQEWLNQLSSILVGLKLDNEQSFAFIMTALTGLVANIIYSLYKPDNKDMSLELIDDLCHALKMSIQGRLERDKTH